MVVRMLVAVVPTLGKRNHHLALVGKGRRILRGLRAESYDTLGLVAIAAGLGSECHSEAKPSRIWCLLVAVWFPPHQGLPVDSYDFEVSAVSPWEPLPSLLYATTLC